MKTENVYASIDTEVKNKAEAILQEIGIPVSVAINMYYKQIILSNGIPFKLTPIMPNDVNLDTMTKSEFDIEMQKRYEDMLNNEGIDEEEFFKDLKKV